PAGGVHAKAVRTTVWTCFLREPSASLDGRACHRIIHDSAAMHAPSGDGASQHPPKLLAASPKILGGTDDRFTLVHHSQSCTESRNHCRPRGGRAPGPAAGGGPGARFVWDGSSECDDPLLRVR